MGSFSCSVFFLYTTLLSTSVGKETSQIKHVQPKELLIVTVATNTKHDGYLQFVESCKQHNLELLTVGEGQKWTGQKINLLKEALEKYKTRDDLAILVTDSYDVIMHGQSEAILAKFRELEANIVFAADVYVWPNERLATKYPPARSYESPYLNSGGYIGYAPDIYELLTDHKISDSDDDQLYFTNLFLDEYQSQLHGGDAAMYKSGDSTTTVDPNTATKNSPIKLDTRSTIFQVLNGVLDKPCINTGLSSFLLDMKFGADQVEVKYKMSKSYLYNHRTGTTPLVIHGNGPAKPKFYRMTSYLNNAWTPTTGCTYCDKVKWKPEDMKELPSICMSIIILKITPFLPHFLDRISKLSYPKDKLDVILYNKVEYHTRDVLAFVDSHRSHEQYRSIEMIGPEAQLNQAEIKNQAVAKCQQKDREYYFTIDSMTQLSYPDSIQSLLSANRSWVTPVISRHEKLWSTFWGEISERGFYGKSDDYADIVNRVNLGVWNVPYTNNVQLIKSAKFALFPRDPYSYGNRFDPDDYDVAFAFNARETGVFQHVDNQIEYGHLINADDYDTNKPVPDLHQLTNNAPDWEIKYLHAEFYSKSVNKSFQLEEPCPDVYWFPMVTEKYCEDLILTMETYGKWSNGENTDSRLERGYENVPTRDIHMNQVGLEEEWLEFLRKYVKDVQLKQYPGYNSKMKAHMNFVVRYRADEQASLQPHHDAATFTVNMALNTPNVDYSGGGVKFLRYDCTLKDLRKGWMLIHPGRLTHYHEGLTTLSGTRYIMVSFVDP